MNDRRFAIYYAPDEEGPLSRAASAWWSSDKWRNATESPRGYGFHATLKPPFRLAAGADEPQLTREFERFAAAKRPFVAPRLQLASLGDFIALVLSEFSREFADLADAAVQEFDRFRAAPSPLELERRRKATLNPRQLELLERWGYPYVFEEWRFHMTLTGPLEAVPRRKLQTLLRTRFEPHCRNPFRVDSICLFEQPEADAPFRCRMRLPLR